VPVSGGTDLPAASARAVWLTDRDVAIWRSKSGVASAWLNRCPHRGMRLSFGQVRGENLVCRYHGWAFEPSGQCQGIPASPEMTPPPTACVETYACREALGLIWLNTADDNADDLSALAADSEIAQSPLFCKSIYVDGTIDSIAGRLSRAGPGFETSEIAPGLFSLSASSGDEDLLLGVQACSPSRLGLHIVAKSDADEDANNQRRLDVGKRAQRLRWQLSNPEAEQ
jgi:nitrite reductase/ring-hydroxylating ferredoxin subunit